MTLSIIIPIFNEEKTIVEILNKVLKVKLPKNIKKEVILIDDGSNDKSKLKIQASKFIKKIKLISHEKNLGKGAAIRSGLNLANGDYIIIQDADLEYDPNDYTKLLEPVLLKKAKVVYGTRLVDYPLRFWGNNKTVMPIHLLANKFLTALTNLFYGSNLTDMETCYKLFSNKVLKNIQLESSGFNFEAEITAKILKLNISIIEVPIRVNPRTYKEGKKINWVDGIIAIWTLFKYKFTN